MADKELERLNSDMSKAKRIKELLGQSGWQDVESILHEFWQNGFEKIRQGDIANPNGILEGKLQMKLVEDLHHKITLTMGFGEQAFEKYKEKYQ